MLGIYLDEFATDLDQNGAVRFLERLPRGNVLLGVGVQSPFMRANKHSMKSTTNLNDLIIEAVTSSMAIHNRVWPLGPERGDLVIRPWPGLGPKSLVEIRVGRTSGNHIVLPESSVSRDQAAFWCYRDTVTVVDLGSKNGTFVDGGRLDLEETYPLVGGEFINLGRFRFRYLLRRDFLRVVENHLDARCAHGGFQAA